MKRRILLRGFSLLGFGYAGLKFLKNLSISRQRRVVQPLHTGHGTIYHRNYWIDIAKPTLSVESMLDDIKTNFADYSPSVLAEFSKCKGDPDTMHVGDEYDIKIFGPWNGMVRVMDIKPMSFDFATLEGHPEAGKIRFGFEKIPNQPDAVRFAIRSQARSRDSLVTFTYEDLGAGKEAQKQTWVTFCERVLDKSGGEAIGEVNVKTEEHRENGEVVVYED